MMSRVAVAVVAAVAMVCAVSQVQAQSFGQELSEVNFDALLAGPLMAVIQAQQLSARETIQYVDQIGFQTDSNGQKTARTVDFSYDSYDSDSQPVRGTITLPLLSMVPIPYLQVEGCDISFSTKLSSTTAVGVSASFALEVGASVPIGQYVTVGASLSVKAQSSFSEQNSRTYSMNVHIHARQAETPQGVMKLLEKLKEATHKKEKTTSSSSTA